MFIKGDSKALEGKTDDEVMLSLMEGDDDEQ